MNSGKTVTSATNIGGKVFEWGSRTYVMGILNVTPDSFSGDGLGADIGSTLTRAMEFEQNGADIIDVGGESTRPPSLYGASQPVSEDEELSRVIPVIEQLINEIDIPISIDSYKAKVADEAITAGASMANDVCALRGDPEMAKTIAAADVPVVLMHNQRQPCYEDVVRDVVGGLKEAVVEAISAGIRPSNVIVDPGIGFGKTVAHNLELLRRLKEFHSIPHPLLIGTSRKSLVGRILDLPVNDRIEGTAATVSLSIAGGADIVRVHDVKQMSRVARMADAVVRGKVVT